MKTNSKQQKNSNKGEYLVFYSIIVGIISGGIIALTRYLVHSLLHFMEHLLLNEKNASAQYIEVFALLFVTGLLIHFFIKKEPFIAGNAIPSVNSDLEAPLKGKWKSILPYKFFGAVLTLGSGVTMGLEGPSVQMGAFAGQAIGEIFHRPWSEQRRLITAGISAGLAAAFHAPLTGIVYALEVVRENFSKKNLIPIMLSAFMSDYLVSHIFNTNPVVFIQNIQVLALKEYWLLLFLSVFIGIGGSLFHILLPSMRKFVKGIPLPSTVKHILPLLLSGLICIVYPELFSSGQNLIFYPMGQNPPIGHLLFLFFANYLLMLYCCASELPGGVFFPVLVLGSLLGNIFGQVSIGLGLCAPEALMFLSLLSMAGIFASVVRAPLSAILLVMEMTGSFIMLLPLGILSVLAPLVSRLIVLHTIGNYPEH